MKTKPTKPTITPPAYVVSNCTFHGGCGLSDTTIQAIAKALSQNAKALRQLCQSVEGPTTSLHVGPKS